MFGFGNGSPKASTATSRAALDNLVDVAAIEGSTIKRKDGVYAALIEVEGEFFSMLSLDEQDARLEAYARVLNGLPEKWLLQATLFVEPTDIAGYVQQLDATRTAEGDTPLGRLAEAQQVMAENLASHVLAESTVLTLTGATKQEAEANAKRLQQLLTVNGFKAKTCSPERIGAILQVCYGQPQVSLPDVMGGINAFLRRGADTKQRKSAAPQIKIQFGRKKPGDLHLNVAPEETDVLSRNAVSLADVISPPAVVEHPGHLELGGAHSASLMVVAYPERAMNGWLERLLHFTHGNVRRRVSFFVEPISSAKAVAEIQRKLIDLDTNTRWQAKRGLRADIQTEVGQEDAEILRYELGRGTQRMFDVTLMVTLTADTPEDLRDAVNLLKQDAAGYSLLLRETWLEEPAAFRTTMPLGNAVLRRVRPIPTLPLSTTFPFTSGELLHEKGEMWGQNLSTGNAVIIDPKRYSPAHLLIVAKTRSGKSFVMKVLATQALFSQDQDVMVLDPSPAIDYKRWTQLLDGTYARFGAGSDDRINPCEILLPFDLKRLDDDMRRPVTAKISFLQSLFEMMAYPDDRMPSEERSLLETPLGEMYAEFGMTDDWQSIVDRTTLTAVPKAKRSPTLQDALRHIEATPGLESLVLKLRPFVHGTLDMFSGETNLDMGKRLVVFNVHSLAQGQNGKYLQAVAYAMISEFIRWRLAMAKRTVLVAVDEAHIMFGREDTARFVSQLYRMAGKLGGRVALMTQGITDLLGDPVTGVKVEGEAEARVCLTNTGITFLLRNDKQSDLELIQREYRLTDAETRMIFSARPGQGIVVAGEERAFVQVEATPALYPFITTRPEEVEAFAAEGLFALDQDNAEWSVTMPSDESQDEKLNPVADVAAAAPVFRLTPETPAGPSRPPAAPPFTIKPEEEPNPPDIEDDPEPVESEVLPEGPDWDVPDADFAWILDSEPPKA